MAGFTCSVDLYFAEQTPGSEIEVIPSLVATRKHSYAVKCSIQVTKLHQGTSRLCQLVNELLCTPLEMLEHPVKLDALELDTRSMGGSCGESRDGQMP